MSGARFIQNVLQRHHRFLKYCAVGAVGFLADFGGTEVLFQSGIDVQIARILAMSLAILTTYVLHKKYTFEASPKTDRVAKQFFLFYATQAFSAVLNYAVFFVLIHLLPETWGIAARFLSISAGVATGLVTNYFLLRAYVFPDVVISDKTGKKFSQRVILIFTLLFMFLVIVPGVQQTQILLSNVVQNKSFGAQDPDIWLRMLKVREWVTGVQGYYDHNVLKTNAPYGGIETPWTRPMDFLLAIGYLMTPKDFSVNTRLMLAATWLPLIGAFITLGFLCAAVLRLRHFYVLLAVVAFFLLTPMYQWRFSSLDIDHHFLLSLLWCVVLSLIIKLPPTRVRALGMGAVLGTMIWISLESVILTGIIYVMAGLYAVKYPKMRIYVFCLTLAVASVAALGLVLEYPLRAAITDVTYDTLSIVHVFVFGLIAATMGVLSQISWTGQSATVYTRLSVYGISAAFCVLVSVFFFPLLLQGPFAQMHPYMKDVFLPTIQEAQPIYDHGLVVLLYCLIPLSGAVVSLVAAWPKKQQQALRRFGIILLGTSLFVTFGMISLHARWIYYFFPVVIISMAGFMPGVATQARHFLFSPLQIFPRLVRFPVALSIYGILIAITALVPINVNIKGDITGFRCQRGPLQQMIHGGELEKILGKKSLILLTRQDLSSDVLFFTPYRVIAANYHREGQGMADLAAIQDATTADDLRAKLNQRQVDVLFYCPTLYKEGTILRNIGTGDAPMPSWLKKVDILNNRVPDKEGGQQPVLFRVLR